MNDRRPQPLVSLRPTEEPDPRLVERLDRLTSDLQALTERLAGNLVLINKRLLDLSTKLDAAASAAELRAFKANFSYL